MLGLLAALVGGVLVIIYPHTDLVARVKQAAPDDLTLRYMFNLLRTDAANHRVRMLLATHEMRRGRTADARKTLAPLAASSDPALRNEATWLVWQSWEVEYKSLPLEHPRRPALAHDLLKSLRGIDISTLPEHDISRVVDAAFGLGDDAYAMELLHRAARLAAVPDEWFAARARAALGRGEYRLAADFYLLARERAETIPRRRQWFILALRALQSGNRLREALSLAEAEIGELAGDRETLIFLANLARAAGDGVAAERYARRLLQLALRESMNRLAAGAWFPRPVSVEPQAGLPGEPGLPFDRDAYRLGFTIFVENGKLEEAWRVASSAVRQRPKSHAWRERLAQVSEWTGRPVAALEHWRWLAMQTDRADAWSHVRRLATMLNDTAALTELTRRDAAGGNLAANLRLAFVLEEEGQPAEALAVIDRLLGGEKSPARRLELRRARLALLDRMGRADEALAESARLIATPGALLSDQKAHAERLADLDRRDEALALLEALEASDPEWRANVDSEFLRFYADLASQLDRTDLAERIYRQLAARRDANDTDRETAFWSLRETGPDAAFEVARQAWLDGRRPADLERALVMALATRRTAEGITLLEAMPPDEWMRLSSDPAFPRVAVAAARLVLAAGRRNQAIAVLKDALHRAPDDAPLSENLLWLAIEIASELAPPVDAEPRSPDRELLIRLLAAYEPRWARQPALHDALAAAWLVLGEPERALHRYLRPQLGRRYGQSDWRKNYDGIVAGLEREFGRNRLSPSGRMAGARIADRRRGPVDERELGGEAMLSLGAGLFVGADFAHRRFAVNDATQVGTVPGSEREAVLSLGHDNDTGPRTVFSLISHQSDRSSTGWRIEHRRPLDGRLRLEAELARDERSLESLPLVLAGRQDRIQLDLAWDATPRDALTLTLRRDTYRVEGGPDLGGSRRVQLEAAHRILAGGAFDLSASAFIAQVTMQHKDLVLTDPGLVRLQDAASAAAGPPDAGFFVPPGFGLKGVRLSSGLEYRDGFTRTPRPYLSLARSWHSLYGAADEREFGVAASVFGHDHLRLGLVHGRTASGGAETYRELLLSYRLHY